MVLDKLSWVVAAQGIFAWVQWPLVVWSFVQLTYAADLLRRRHVLPRSLLAFLSSPSNSPAQSVDEQLQKHDSDLADVVGAGVSALQDGATEDELTARLQTALEDVELAQDRRLGMLSALAHISMMVGLLGTVWGLTATFVVISESNIAPQPRELASGVSQALVTTIFGLCVAIPLLLCYAVLHGRRGRWQFELRLATERIFQRGLLAPQAEDLVDCALREPKSTRETSGPPSSSPTDLTHSKAPDGRAAAASAAQATQAERAVDHDTDD